VPEHVAHPAYAEQAWHALVDELRKYPAGQLVLLPATHVPDERTYPAAHDEQVFGPVHVAHELEHGWHTSDKAFDVLAYYPAGQLTTQLYD